MRVEKQNSGVSSGVEGCAMLSVALAAPAAGGRAFQKRPARLTVGMSLYKLERYNAFGRIDQACVLQSDRNEMGGFKAQVS